MLGFARIRKRRLEEEASQVMASERDQALNGGGRHPPSGRRAELVVFLILAVLIWPFIAVGVVGGYGFLVWMWQIVFGPPGPPG